jgi:hypothetical protein
MNLTPGPSKLEKLVDPCSGPRGPLPKSQFSRDTTGRNFPNFHYRWCPFIIGMVQVLPPMVTLQKIRSIFPAKQHQVVGPAFR